MSNSSQRGSNIKTFQRRSSRAFRHIEALVAVSIALAFAAAIARLDAQAADSSEISSSLQDEMTRSSLLCQQRRYSEAEPILLRCLSQYELTGNQDAFLLSILTNLELVYSQLGKEKEAAACQTKRRALEAKFDAVDMNFATGGSKERMPQYRAPRPAARTTTNSTSSSSSPSPSPSPSPSSSSSLSSAPSSPSSSSSLSSAPSSPSPFPSSSPSLPQELRVPSQERELGAVVPTSSGIPAEVKEVIAATEHDRELISDPTTAERTVFDHYETRYRDVTVGLQTPYQEPVYRRELYNVTKESEIPVFEDLHSICARHSLAETVYQRCKDAIINGGAVFELDNGFAVLVQERVNPDDWRSAKVLMQKLPTLPLPGIALSNLRTGDSLNCEVLDSR